MRNANIVYKEAMELLVLHLGIIETEMFVSEVLKHRFDYTEWQREYFAHYTANELLQRASEYEKQHPETIPTGKSLEDYAKRK
jgi:hypothetical protein